MLSNVPANGTDPELTGHCVAGFIDAEGHFAVVEMSGGGSFSCYMIVAVRDDDVDLLHAMARTTGLGVVRHKDFRGNAQACWSVYRKERAVALAEYLTRHPLRTRKRHDFEAWSAAVKVWTRSGRNRSARMSTLARRIREVRRYSPPDLVVVAPAVRRNGFYDWFGGSSRATDTWRFPVGDRGSLSGFARTTRRSSRRSVTRRARASSTARIRIADLIRPCLAGQPKLRPARRGTPACWTSPRAQGA